MAGVDVLGVGDEPAGVVEPLPGAGGAESALSGGRAGERRSSGHVSSFGCAAGAALVHLNRCGSSRDTLTESKRWALRTLRRCLGEVANDNVYRLLLRQALSTMSMFTRRRYAPQQVIRKDFST